MGAYLRLLGAFALGLVLLAPPLPAEAQAVGGGGRSRAQEPGVPLIGSGLGGSWTGIFGPHRRLLKRRPNINRRRDRVVRPGPRGRGPGDYGRRGRYPYSRFGSPYYGFSSDFLPPYALDGYSDGGYGYDGGEGGVVFYEAPGPPVPTVRPPVSQSTYALENGVLRQYDRQGRLLRETPIPSRPWPQGGRDARDAVRHTGGYWGARLVGLQAANFTAAKGFATFWLDSDGDRVSFRLDLRNIRNVTGATINLTDPSLPTAAAPPVVPLYTGRVIGGRYSGTLAAGRISSDTLTGWLSNHPIGSLVQAFDSGQAMVVVTTAQHPQGELMGAVASVLRDEPEP